jgi:hypothetical protein
MLADLLPYLVIVIIRQMNFITFRVNGARVARKGIAAVFRWLHQ